MLKTKANLEKMTLSSKYRPTPMFMNVRLLLTDANISRVAKMMAKVSLPVKL
jgi:hypothetical protein